MPMEGFVASALPLLCGCESLACARENSRLEFIRNFIGKNRGNASIPV